MARQYIIGTPFGALGVDDAEGGREYIATGIGVDEGTAAAATGPIAFRSLTSLSYASRTNTVLTAPAGLANGDILVALILTAASGTAPTPTAPAGFTQFGTATSVADASTFNGVFRIFWKRAASESGSYTFTHTSCSSQGVLKAYSGCLASGTPLGATSNNSGGEEISTGTGITTTAANSYLLFEAHDWTGSGTLSPPSGMTERFDNLVYSADQLISAAGATGNRVQTNGNPAGIANNKWAVRLVELLADTGAPPVSTGTLTATLGDATGSLTGTVTVGGTAAGTALPATLVGTGTVTTGAVELHENVRETEAGDWREIEDGTIRIVDSISLGTLSTTLDAATFNATGKVYVGGTLAVTLGAATATMTGKVTVGGTAAGTALPATLVATGTAVNQIYSGSLTATLAAATLSATGTVVTVVAPTADNVRETEAGDWRETEDGTVRIVDTIAVGSLAVTLGDATGTLTGKVTVGGTAAGTAAPAVLVGTGTVTLGPPPPDLDGVRETEAGDWRETEDGTIRLIDRTSLGTLSVTLGAATLSGTGKVSVGGTAAGTLLPAMLVATGTVSTPSPGTITGTLNVTLAPATLAAVGFVGLMAGTLAVTLDDATLLAGGHVSARWTPEPPPWNAWIKEATASAAWTAEPSPSRLWTSPTLAEGRITSTFVGRITDDGRLRITDGEYLPSGWQKEIVPANRWQH